MIPIRDANPTRRVPWVTLALIGVNVAAFLMWQPTFGTQAQQQGFFYCNAAIPWEIAHGSNLADGGPAARRAIDQDLRPGAGVDVQTYMERRCPDKSWLASIFISMFLHGGWLHIAGNMLFLWVFGNNVEDRLGRLAFIAFYLLGGVAAMLLQLAMGPNSTIPTVGASGAIAAVLGSYLVLFPHARVTTLVVFFFITAVDLPAGVVLMTWFVLQLFSGVGQLGTNLAGGVAYWAHVGGFVFGAVVTWAIFRGRRRPPERPVIWVPPPPDYR